MSKEPATNATSKDLPTRKELVQAFLRRHSLSESVSPIAVEPAIYWADATLLLLQFGFGGTSETLINDPTSGLFFNMLNRNFEAVEGNLSRFSFCWGHASVQTTERYLGCKQKLSQAVNDNLGLEFT
jgi:hypothetical protein